MLPVSARALRGSGSVGGLLEGSPTVEGSPSGEGLGSGRRGLPRGSYVYEYVHRLVYFLVHGPFPDTDPKQVVMHVCSNRRCLNPWHLVLGARHLNPMMLCVDALGLRASVTPSDFGTELASSMQLSFALLEISLADSLQVSALPGCKKLAKCSRRLPAGPSSPDGVGWPGTLACSRDIVAQHFP
jgi:hypothetical protein